MIKKHRVIIYALGQLFWRNKDNIIWDCVVAASDKNYLEKELDNDVMLVAPSEINGIEYDFVAIFSNVNYERIKRELIGKYGVKEENIISWRAIVRDGKANKLYGMEFIRDYIKENGFEKVLDCSSDGVNSFLYSNHNIFGKEKKIDRFTNDIKSSYAIEYSEVYNRIADCKETYDIVFTDKYCILSDILNYVKANHYVYFNNYEDISDVNKLKKIKENLPSDFYLKNISLCAGNIYIIEKKESFNNTNCSMYVVVHKDFNVRNDDLYIPICVGGYHSDKIMYNDMVGKNIANLNGKLNECTALYWVWKNKQTDYIGINHYRRYFFNNNQEYYENILDNKHIDQYLREYDIIMCNHIEFGCRVKEQLRDTVSNDAYEEGYRIVRSSLQEVHPEDVDVFDYVMNLFYFFPCNMFVTKWDKFDEYCKWLFSFIIKAAEKIDVTKFDDYSKRIIGFFAERMMTVWVIKNRLKVKELPYFTID